jgi:hypothetical protein
MNERIKELAEQAEMSANQGDHVDVNMMMEKFAELIVRQCAKVAFNDWCEGTNESSSEMAILKHFGVEE